jgi:RNA polymerase sigma-70 factor, ECF subfamily
LTPGEPDNGRAALIQLFTQDRYALEGYILAIVRDPHLAADIYQDVSVVILEDLDRFDASRDFRAWARGIARNKAKQALSQSSRLQTMPSERIEELVELAYEEQGDETWGVLAQYGQYLNDFLMKLTTTVRRILDLRYGKDLSLKQVAELMGKSEGSIQVALSRAREALHHCLDRCLRSSSGDTSVPV